MPTSRSKFRLTALAGLLLAAPAFAVSHGQPVPKRHTSPAKAILHVPTAEELFVKVLSADDSFTYRGRKVTTYWRTGRTTAVNVFHRPVDDRRIYYLSPKSQRGLLIVSDGHEEWQYDPHTKELSHRRLSPGALDEDDVLSYTLLRANYYLMVDPKPRVYAERKVCLVTIKRPQGHTLARKFWIDTGSGLILKREIYGDDGELAVTRAFTEITYHPKPSSDVFSLSSLSSLPGLHTVETSAAAERPIPLNSLSLPLAGEAYAPFILAGYRLVGASATAVGGKPVLHLRYSDGLNLVSLFEQRRTQARRPTLVKGMQKTLIGSVPAHVSRRASLTTLNWDTATLNVTLMGEMGVKTFHSLALAAVQNK
jgi:outer membrane lipoprotein-sorting protein